MLTNEIPMDALTALAAERRHRYTDEAQRFRLGRLAGRARRDRRRRARASDRTGDAGSAGTRVTVSDHDLCA